MAIAVVFTPPAAVPMKLGTQCFLIESGGSVRQAISESQTLCFFFSPEIRDSDVELLLVTEQ
jgi:predicted component of type VI protein secretion system